MNQPYDVIVLGLGAMGSASLYQLSKRGVNVLGIDQFNPPHSQGSSHGDTRITRQAIGEGDEYVPLALRSHEIWKELEQKTGATLFTKTGLIILGNAEAAGIHGKKNFIEQTIESARKYSIPHEILNTEELKKRFPAFNLQGSEKGFYEHGAGFLLPETCVNAQLTLAKQYGAQIHTNEKILSWKTVADGSVEVRSVSATYRAKKLIVSAGPWIADLIPEYSHIFKVYRQVLYWFDIKSHADAYTPDRFPVFVWDFGNGKDVYGFPAIDGAAGGLKIASESYEVPIQASAVDRKVSAQEVATMYKNYIEDRFMDVSNTCLRSTVCLYTVTPDSGFVIDTHPRSENILLASPCSGHGFKHSAAIGETLAQITLGEKIEIDISKFRLGRFLNS